MNRLAFYVSLIAWIISLQACTVPEVSDQQAKVLVIASDFLTARDSLIFRDFERSTKTKIRIVHLSADSIIAHVDAYGYNTRFDGVFLYTSYNLNRLSKAEVLHQLPETIKEHPISIRAPKNDWLILGFDPYVLQQADSGVVIETYNELTYGPKWTPVLSPEESAAFEASVLHQFGRSGQYKSYTWLKFMYGQTRSVETDSVGHAGFTLNRFSQMKNDTVSFKIPNQVRGGTFYDGTGIAAIRHSRHYSEVCALIEFYTNPHYNQKLTGHLHLFPVASPNGHSDIDYQNDYPVFFHCSPNQCVRQYRNLERMRRKL